MMRALVAEFAKLNRSRMLLWTLLPAFGYAALDLIAGPFVSSPEGIERISQAGGAFGEAALTGKYDPTWTNYLPMVTQMLAGGLALMIFALIIAYVFGREFKGSTMAQSLTVPLRREYMVLAKFVVGGVWIFALAALMFGLHVLDLAIVGMDGFTWDAVFSNLADSALVVFMLFLTIPVFAWIAVRTRGYLWAVLGSIVLGGMGNNLIASDISVYYPWNMPVHLFGASWMPIAPSAELTVVSWAILVGLFVLTLVATMRRVNSADVLA